MLWLVQRLFFGPEGKLTASTSVRDLSFGEFIAVAPLVALMLILGVSPTPLLDSIQSGLHPPSAQIKQVIQIPINPQTVVAPEAKR